MKYTVKFCKNIKQNIFWVTRFSISHASSPSTLDK